MTGWYFVVVFLIISAIAMVLLPGTSLLALLFIVPLGSITLYLLMHLDKLQGIEARLKLVSKSGFFIAALETCIGRVKDKRLCLGALSAWELERYRDNVELLPILVVLVRDHSSSDARAVGLIQVAEFLIEECAKKQKQAS